jgi:hypothetical protein
VAGTFSFTIKAANGVSPDDTALLSITIVDFTDGSGEGALPATGGTLADISIRADTLVLWAFLVLVLGTTFAACTHHRQHLTGKTLTRR